MVGASLMVNHRESKQSSFGTCQQMMHRRCRGEKISESALDFMIMASVASSAALTATDPHGGEKCSCCDSQSSFSTAFDESEHSSFHPRV